MSDYLVSVASLNRGEKLKFSLTLFPDFFELEELELRFLETVYAVGEAYLMEEGDLMLHFDAKTKAQMPCSVCNCMISVPLEVKGVHHIVEKVDISEAFFDLRPVFREELLLELPQITECQGCCPERDILAPYLRSKEVNKSHFPFSDL